MLKKKVEEHFDGSISPARQQRRKKIEDGNCRVFFTGFDFDISYLKG